MAEPTTDTFNSMKIYVGDGESPEEFDLPCGFNSKSLTLSAATSTAIVAPCPDDEDPDPSAPWEHAGVSANSAVVQGDGVMAEESYPRWVELFEAGQPFNVRVAKRLGYWEGQAIITSLGETSAFGQNAELIQLAVGMRNANKWTWVPAT